MLGSRIEIDWLQLDSALITVTLPETAAVKSQKRDNCRQCNIKSISKPPKIWKREDTRKQELVWNRCSWRAMQFFPDCVTASFLNFPRNHATARNCEHFHHCTLQHTFIWLKSLLADTIPSALILQIPSEVLPAAPNCSQNQNLWLPANAKSYDM